MALRTLPAAGPLCTLVIGLMLKSHLLFTGANPAASLAPVVIASPVAVRGSTMRPVIVVAHSGPLFLCN